MVRIGVIGAGSIAQGSCSAFAEHPEAEIVAVAEPNAERAAEFALRYDTVTQVVEEPERLLAIDEVDAVYIAVPNHLHAPLSALSLQAGKHVLQEKPLALSREDAEQTAAAARAADTHFMLGMNQRFTRRCSAPGSSWRRAGSDAPTTARRSGGADRGYRGSGAGSPARRFRAAADCWTSACTCWTTRSSCSTTSGRARCRGRPIPSSATEGSARATGGCRNARAGSSTWTTSPPRSSSSTGAPPCCWKWPGPCTWTGATT